MSKWIIALCVIGLSACGGGGSQLTQPAQQPPPISNVAAFMGDSITHRWDLTQYDPNTTLNFGVSGDTTAQMLARFGEVTAAAPGVVVILGGINDMQIHDTSTDNIVAMAKAAKAAGIRVILCSVTPIDYLGIDVTLPEIEAFNVQLLQIAKGNGYLYADYYYVMLTADGLTDDTLFADGLHPNAAGYAKMWAVIAPLLAEDLN
jgi:lysophospholipase L1-like esterase